MTKQFYLKNTKKKYKYNFLKDDLELKCLTDKNNDKNNIDLIIPYKYLGKIKNPLTLFDQFNFSKIKLYKKGLILILIAMLIYSIVLNPINIIIYAIIYIIGYLLWLFNSKNPNYINLLVYAPKEERTVNLIFLFDDLESKNDFFTKIKEHNDSLLGTKSYFGNVKDSITNIIQGTKSENTNNTNNID